MSSCKEQLAWACSLGWFVLLLSLQISISTAFNNSSDSNSTDNSTSIPSTTYPTTTLTPIPNRTIPTTSTKGILPSSTYTVVPSVSGNSTAIPATTTPGKPAAMETKLSSFGIVMLSLGGVLIVILVVCLMGICCHGRERGPGGTHVPHSNVKMKPWRSAELSTGKELTEDTIDALETTNHSQSHHNVGLTNSPRMSPSLSPSANNNTSLSTPTGSFRNLQTHPPGGDFGRKLSLGRQAYEPQNESPDEKTAEHEPSQEAKGKQDDMTTIHYV